MNEPIVAVASFWDLSTAHHARAMLEDRGIRCVLADENTVGVLPFHVGVVGGVKANVLASDYAEAHRVLAEFGLVEAEEGDDGDDAPATEDVGPTTPGEELDSDLPVCPRCASDDVSYEKLSKRMFFLGILLLGFPFLVFSGTWRCVQCDKRWT